MTSTTHQTQPVPKRAAVSYLAEPGRRHMPPPNLDPGTLAGRGPDPLDAGALLVKVTAAGRVAFVAGGSSTPMLDADLVDAVVHAARAGYQLCLGTADTGQPRYRCWLPARHPGACERRGWWRWILLYGYRGPVTQVCTSCTPHRHVPAPPDCPHR